MEKFIERYDTDSLGSLEFGEFLDMVADGKFKFKMSESLREGMRELLEADYQGDQTIPTENNPFLGSQT